MPFIRRTWKLKKVVTISCVVSFNEMHIEQFKQNPAVHKWLGRLNNICFLLTFCTPFFSPIWLCYGQLPCTAVFVTLSPLLAMGRMWSTGKCLLWYTKYRLLTYKWGASSGGAVRTQRSCYPSPASHKDWALVLFYQCTPYSDMLLGVSKCFCLLIELIWF